MNMLLGTSTEPKLSRVHVLRVHVCGENRLKIVVVACRVQRICTMCVTSQHKS